MSGKEQVTMLLPELLIDELTRFPFQRRPVNPGGQRGRQKCLQQGRHLLRATQIGFDEMIVRVVHIVLIHAHSKALRPKTGNAFFNLEDARRKGIQ